MYDLVCGFVNEYKSAAYYKETRESQNRDMKSVLNEVSFCCTILRWTLEQDDE